jgi:hypothetical protein
MEKHALSQPRSLEGEMGGDEHWILSWEHSLVGNSDNIAMDGDVFNITT